MKISHSLLLVLCGISLSISPALAQNKKNKDQTTSSQKAKNSSNKKTTATKDNAQTEDKKEEQTIDESSLLGRMALAVQGYYAAKSPKGKLAFVIDPQKVEPLMRDFYFREALIPGTVAQMTSPEAFSLNGVSFWRTQVALNDGRQSFLAIKMIGDTPKIDWASEVRYSPQNWDEWLEKGTKGDVSEFRVYAETDAHYPKEFSHAEKYRCIKIRSADSTNTLFAYLDLSDLDQSDFAQMLAQGQRAECVLSLQIVAIDNGIPLAKVVKVVSPSWVIPDTSK